MTGHGTTAPRLRHDASALSRNALTDNATQEGLGRRRNRLESSVARPDRAGAAEPVLLPAQGRALVLASRSRRSRSPAGVRRHVAGRAASGGGPSRRRSGRRCARRGRAHRHGLWLVPKSLMYPIPRVDPSRKRGSRSLAPLARRPVEARATASRSIRRLPGLAGSGGGRTRTRWPALGLIRELPVNRRIPGYQSAARSTPRLRLKVIKVVVMQAVPARVGTRRNGSVEELLWSFTVTTVRRRVWSAGGPLLGPLELVEAEQCELAGDHPGEGVQRVGDPVLI